MIIHKGFPLTQAQLDAIVPVLNLRPMPRGKRLETLCEQAMADAGQPLNAQPSKPCRVQRKRTSGFKLPPFTKCVDRSSLEWGNPFPVGAGPDDYTQEEAVAEYVEWLRMTPEGGRVVALARYELRGYNLACYCKPGTPCHSAPLLKEANAKPTADDRPFLRSEIRRLRRDADQAESNARGRNANEWRRRAFKLTEYLKTLPA